MLQKKRKPYKQLNRDDRIKIETLYNSGASQSEIAKKIGCDKSTISRELKKGLYEHLNDYKLEIRYSYDKAQSITEFNLSHRGSQYLKIDFQPEYAHFIEDQVRLNKKSPEVALEKAKEAGFDFSICIRTFYNYIDMEFFQYLTFKDLPHRRKRKKRKVKAYKTLRTDAPTIDERPKEIDDREIFGHWEMDTVKGQKGKTKGCLLVFTERKTRYEIIHYMKNQKTESVVQFLNHLESIYGDSFKDIFKTITVDNGSEFADYQGMVHSFKLDPKGKKHKRTEIYYCHPYASWERGTNENNNRMIRRFIPKGKDFDKESLEFFKYIEDWMNDYPRRMFGFKTAAELFAEEIKLIS